MILSDALAPLRWGTISTLWLIHSWYRFIPLVARELSVV